jgi:hypothetical protein
MILQPKPKKKFIEKKKAVSFQLVQRSQRDPSIVDDEVPQYVLRPVAPPNLKVRWCSSLLSAQPSMEICLHFNVSNKVWKSEKGSVKSRNSVNYKNMESGREDGEEGMDFDAYMKLKHRRNLKV